MKISLKARHLKRYKDIALLFLKYGRSDMVQQFGELLEESELPTAQAAGSKPEELADDLERMGPTFIKLGQVLSSRADLLPKPYLDALSRLQDKIKPFPYAEVEQIVERELGVRISKAFSRFEAEPMAAASLGQVHGAALREGRPVVVKIQRPNIRQQIAEDFEVLTEIALFLEEHTKMGKRYQFQKIFEEFKTTLIQELDYEREAANLTALAENLKEFDRIRVPLPVADYTTSSVLTMDYIRGKKVTFLGPLARLEIEGGPLAEQLFAAYLKQVLVDGLFHADPHPGNVFLTEDGQIALLDLGMIGRLTSSMQDNLLKLLLAVSEGNSESAADLAIRMSEPAEDFSEKDFRRTIGQLLAEQKDNSLQQLDVGTTLLELARNAGGNGLYVPTELTLLGKTLLQLEEIGRTLDPDFNPNAAIRSNVGQIMRQRMKIKATSASMFGSLLEMKDFMAALPGRLNKLLDALTAAEFAINLKSETNLLLEGFQKIANRITTGLILAALIIGASLLMQVQTKFQIFGYPGLAMLCFLAAAGLGFWLVVSILFQDRKRRKKRSE